MTDQQHSPYAQVVRVHTDGHRVIVVARDSFYGAVTIAARLNALLTANDDFRFVVERENLIPDTTTLCTCHSPPRPALLASAHNIPGPWGRTAYVHHEGNGIYRGATVRTA